MTILWTPSSYGFPNGCPIFPVVKKPYLVEKDYKNNGKLHSFKKLTGILGKNLIWFKRTTKNNQNAHFFSWMPPFSHRCFAFPRKPYLVEKDYETNEILPSPEKHVKHITSLFVQKERLRIGKTRITCQWRGNKGAW